MERDGCLPHFLVNNVFAQTFWRKKTLFPNVLFDIEAKTSFGNKVRFIAADRERIVIGFNNAAWIAPIEGDYVIKTVFSTQRRNDTGRINSTPRVITTPVIRLQVESPQPRPQPSLFSLGFSPNRWQKGSFLLHRRVATTPCSCR